MRQIYEKLAEELSRRGLKARIIAVGRSALELYGIESEYTQDIDFELVADERTWEEIDEIIGELGIRADYGEDFDRWSVVPMPEGYRKRVNCVIKRGEVEVCVLDPVDYVIAKMRRGTEEDERDAIAVIRKFNLKREEIEKSLELIRPIRDVEFFLFKKRMERFFSRVFLSRE